jgi:hypothetical protein
MKSMRWDLLACSLIIGASLIVAAVLAAPNHYALISHVEGRYVRLDRESGEMVECQYLPSTRMNCRSVAIETPEERAIEQTVSDTRNELGD